jgi:hypothetical protein
MHKETLKRIDSIEIGYCGFYVDNRTKFSSRYQLMLAECSGLSNNTEMRSCSTFSVSWIPAVPYQDVLHSSGEEFRAQE